jgi:hypothetical protein
VIGLGLCLHSVLRQFLQIQDGDFESANVYLVSNEVNKHFRSLNEFLDPSNFVYNRLWVPVSLFEKN